MAYEHQQLSVLKWKSNFISTANVILAFSIYTLRKKQNI